MEEHDPNITSEQLIGFLDCMNDAIWLANAGDGRYLFINRAISRIYGLPRQAFFDNPGLWLECVHPDDQDRASRSSLELIEHDRSTIDYRIILPDGSLRWIQDHKVLIRDAHGTPTHIGGIASDISDSKQVEHLLRTSYHDLFERAGDPMYLLDTDGTILALNPAWEQVTGHCREEWLGRSFTPLVHPDDLELTMARFGEVIQAGGTLTFETRYRSGSGEFRRAEHCLTTRPAINGALSVIGIARDLTERRRAEEDRLRLEQNIQHSQRLESLGILAGGIAHDFNNLLMGIVGNVELAILDNNASSPVGAHLEGIRQAAMTLAGLTNQMLVYAGRGSSQTREVNLSSLIEDTSPLLTVTISKKVRLICELDPQLPAIVADPAQMRQVIMNLCVNAAESIGERSGRVTIRTGQMRMDESDLRNMLPGGELPSGPYVFMEVADEGAGIDDETRLKIFDPFFTTKASGRGLGLAAIVGIVRSHRGAIDVSSRPGQGSVFRILLPPIDKNRAFKSEPAVESHGLSAGSGTILLVDDEPVVRQVTSRILARAGYGVVEARDGCEALELIRKHPERFAAVLLDLTMPRMNGIETLVEIEKLRPDLPVVLTSGYTDEELAGLSESVSFVRKPYTATEVTAAIRKVLGDRPKRKPV